MRINIVVIYIIVVSYKHFGALENYIHILFHTLGIDVENIDCMHVDPGYACRYQWIPIDSKSQQIWNWLTEITPENLASLFISWLWNVIIIKHPILSISKFSTQLNLLGNNYAKFAHILAKGNENKKHTVYVFLF